MRVLYFSPEESRAVLTGALRKIREKERKAREAEDNRLRTDKAYCEDEIALLEHRCSPPPNEREWYIINLAREVHGIEFNAPHYSLDDCVVTT